MNIKYKYRIAKEYIVLREIFWDFRYCRLEYAYSLIRCLFYKTEDIESINNTMRKLISEYGNCSNVKGE